MIALLLLFCTFNQFCGSFHWTEDRRASGHAVVKRQRKYLTPGRFFGGGGSKTLIHNKWAPSHNTCIPILLLVVKVIQQMWNMRRLRSERTLGRLLRRRHVIEMWCHASVHPERTGRFGLFIFVSRSRLTINRFKTVTVISLTAALDFCWDGLQRTTWQELDVGSSICLNFFFFPGKKQHVKKLKASSIHHYPKNKEFYQPVPKPFL